jgi:stress-induced morphogen
MDSGELRRKIANAFPGALVEVVDTTGGGDHFDLLVVSDRFDGLPMLKRHRLVYDALGDLMRAEIHALSLRTAAPSEHDDGIIKTIGRS